MSQIKQGMLIKKNNYIYEGEILQNLPHGIGIFIFQNGDKYEGECNNGDMSGYGIYYYANKNTYTGFFLCGKFHGIGTFEDAKNIYKGTWKNNNKHGFFYKTNKIKFETYQQYWNKNKRIKNIQVQYIQPKALITTYKRPKNNKKYQVSYRIPNDKCVACKNNHKNATNSTCGHVVVCYDCLTKCENCPICRAPIKNIIRLYIS